MNVSSIFLALDYHRDEEDRRSHVAVVFLLIKRKIMLRQADLVDISRATLPLGEALLKNMFSPRAGGELHVST